ncbi:hypothetical protein ABZ864_40725 [Streptomyces sp. NPDC047082]|uniref:hypothetical protein n=1 Tax=Streptomyces sp. NPDC047082 TaxID=3155259 RepID=UPI0033CAA541
MTPPKNRRNNPEDDGENMSDEGVGNLFSGGASPSSAMAGWASATPATPITPEPVATRPVSVIPQPTPAALEEAPEPVVDSDTARPVGFYVSANVASRFRKYRKQHDLTHTQIVFLAVEAAVEKGLAQVVKDARRAPKFQSKLFAVKVDNSDLIGLGPVQLQYKPTKAQYAIIDGFVAESGLPDHTKFLAVVLDQFLPGRREG